MNAHQRKRKRRRARAKLRNAEAVRPHREVAGRTGRGDFRRRNPGKSKPYVSRTAIPVVVPDWWEVNR